MNMGTRPAIPNDPADTGPVAHRPRRLSTATESALKTTEFFVSLASVVAVLIASTVVGTDAGHTDCFRGDKAWLYIVILTVGYMISRGLAKPGSRDPLRRVPLPRRGKAVSGVLYPRPDVQRLAERMSARRDQCVGRGARLSMPPCLREEGRAVQC